MAFWGVEVKPGKPFTHLPGNTRGRLHLSQATLGFGTATTKSVVQCNVGNRSPLLLCSLFPETSESCQLNLEFEEADEVVFSVIGPRSVHLTGYYLGASRHLKLDDESESYGEDIVDTETESSPGVSDEECEDSFIDDDDELMAIPPSPAFSDGAEETSHEGRKKNTKSKHRRLRKTYQLSETDEDMTIISSLIKSDATEGKTDAIIDIEMKRKPREDDHTLPSTVENNSKPKKKEKKKPKGGEVRARVEDEFFSGQTLTWDKTQQNKKKEKTGKRKKKQKKVTNE